jgi:hypothetical protein
MKQSCHSYSPAEFLVLEYKLLLSGKIISDAGETEAHTRARLQQIEQELIACSDFRDELPRLALLQSRK